MSHPFRKYKIFVGPPWFLGPEGVDCLECEEIGKVSGPPLPGWEREHLLLNVWNRIYANEQFEEIVEQVTVVPRYQGDTIETIRSGECMVGVGRILSGNTLSDGEVFSPEQIEYWAIGKSRYIS